MNDEQLETIDEHVRTSNVHELRKLFRAHPELINFHYGVDTWLHVAAHNGLIEVAHLLLELGADPNSKQDGFPMVPLRKTTIHNHVEVARLLLQKGATPDVERIVISAVVNDKPRALEMVKVLDEFGVDLHVIYEDEFTNRPMNALSTAIESGNEKVIAYLRSRGCVLPSERPAHQPPATKGNEIVTYFGKHFGPVHAKSLIEIVPTEPSISIHVIPAGDGRDHLTLFTTGMSERAMKVPKGQGDFRHAELFIQLPGKWPLSKKAMEDPNFFWPIHWLRWVAKYPHQNNTWLGGPVTIIAEDDPSKRFAPKIRFTSMLLLADQELATMDGKTVKLYRMFPLYTEERDLEIKTGIAALLQAFDRHKVPFVFDLKRKNVGKV